MAGYPNLSPGHLASSLDTDAVAIAAEVGEELAEARAYQAEALAQMPGQSPGPHTIGMDLVADDEGRE